MASILYQYAQHSPYGTQNKTRRMALNLEMSVSARAHAQLWYMHRSQTLFHEPHGENSKNTVLYLKQLLLTIGLGVEISLLLPWQQVSETWLTKAITGLKSRVTELLHSPCFDCACADCLQLISYHIRGGKKIFSRGKLYSKHCKWHLLVQVTLACEYGFQFVDENLLWRSYNPTDCTFDISLFCPNISCDVTTVFTFSHLKTHYWPIDQWESAYYPSSFII